MPTAAQPMTELGRRLDKARRDRGWTVKEMYEAIGVNRPAYINWLRGGTPDVPRLYQIARVLDVAPCDVLDWVDPGSVRPMGRLLNPLPEAVSRLSVAA